MKPYRTQVKTTESPERDFFAALCWAALVGGMVGSIVTMGVLL